MNKLTKYYSAYLWNLLTGAVFLSCGISFFFVGLIESYNVPYDIIQSPEFTVLGEKLGTYDIIVYNDDAIHYHHIATFSLSIIGLLFIILSFLPLSDFKDLKKPKVKKKADKEDQEISDFVFSTRKWNEKEWVLFADVMRDGGCKVPIKKQKIYSKVYSDIPDITAKKLIRQSIDAANTVQRKSKVKKKISKDNGDRV